MKKIKMNGRRLISNSSLGLLGIGVLFLVVSCIRSDKPTILHQDTGPVKTNCYLLYEAKSKEAALIDVGGPIDSLVSHISDHNLKLRYIFATHVHMDHVEGVPEIQELFPESLLCYNMDDYNDFLTTIEWMEEHFPEMTDEMKQTPEFKKWFEYDMAIFKKPDINLDDNQIYKLGNLKIKTILSPGHSRGSICFLVDNAAFTGDVLFYRQVGRTDLIGGSKENIAKSVIRLYNELPDTTKVYPGHGKFTDIGSEKYNNEKVTLDAVTIKN